MGASRPLISFDRKVWLSRLLRLGCGLQAYLGKAVGTAARTLQRRTEILGITDGTLAVHTHAFRHFRVIDNGTDESVPYGCTRSIASAPEREPLRFHEFVMEALVVMHDR